MHYIEYRYILEVCKVVPIFACVGVHYLKCMHHTYLRVCADSVGLYLEHNAGTKRVV